MRKLIKSLILLLIPLSVVGQLTPVSNQYVLNPLTINPAYAGSRGALNLAAFYRKQWVGISGSPETMTLSADAPLFDARLGLGLTITNDKIGVTKETQIMSTYAYKINLGEGSLSLGLGAGIITTNTAWSDLVVLDPGDELYLTDSKVFVLPDFTFGGYYTNQNFFAGFSIPNLLGYRFDYDENKYALEFKPGEYYYLFNTGYLFTLSPKLKLFPSTLVTFSPGEKILFDINVHANLYDRIWLGASYRNGRSVGALAQFAINNQLKLAYIYDFDLGELGTYSNGSHEVMIRYEFKYSVDVVNPVNF